MSNIIPVVSRIFRGKPTQAVNAKNFYSFLSKSQSTRFNDWITRRISEYGFVEGDDYLTEESQTKGRPGTEYYLTIAGTISDLIERYMKEVSPKKAPKTHKDEISSAKLLNNVFGKMNPADIRPAHVAKYLDKRGESAPIRANREKSLLSHMFSMAMRWGIVDSNPCKGVARNKETPRNRFVTDTELECFRGFAKSRSETGILLAEVARLAYLTGQRRGDLLRLRLDQITDDGILIIQGKTSAKVLIQ